MLLRLTILTVVLTVGAGQRTAASQRPGADMSRQARAYLSAALDTLQLVTLGRDTIPWPVLRDSAFRMAAGARKLSDTYGAIDWALRRANKHSFLQAAPPGAASELVDGAYGYIHVPQRGGPAIALADSLHTAVRALQDSNACGWIVDLRDNGGGNMWPMLAGIGPLLGDSIVGRFGVEPGGERWYYRRGVSGVMQANGTIDTASRITVAPVALHNPTAPVAVLIDSGTGSSGEAVAVAFRGRANARTFGSPTAGFATVNRGSRLPDGANMVVTTGYYADRHGTQYRDRLQPETPVEGSTRGWPFATDRVAAAATAWLAIQPACRDRR
jgi:carboxyl-terminal processing protease